MPKLHFVPSEKKWLHGSFVKHGPLTYFVEAEPRYAPHTGNKQLVKNRARNPDQLEYPRGWRPWQQTFGQAARLQRNLDAAPDPGVAAT